MPYLVSFLQILPSKISVCISHLYHVCCMFPPSLLLDLPIQITSDKNSKHGSFRYIFPPGIVLFLPVKTFSRTQCKPQPLVSRIFYLDLFKIPQYSARKPLSWQYQFQMHVSGYWFLISIISGGARSCNVAVHNQSYGSAQGFPAYKRYWKGTMGSSEQ